MADVEDLWEDIAYLKGGKHRYDVFVYLAKRRPSIPSEIANDLTKRDARVTDALRELEAQDLVVLVGPEDQKKGRLRRMTDRGKEVWKLMQDEGMEE